jgi:hypothetical protein
MPAIEVEFIFFGYDYGGKRIFTIDPLDALSLEVSEKLPQG